MRSRTLFLLAILMGLITTTLFIFTLNNEKSEAAETKEVERVEVVVAISAIQPNQVITEELVGVRSIPIDQKHEAAIQNIEDVLNKIAVTQIDANEIILQHRIQSIEEEKDNLSKKITEGSQGVTIGLNIVQSVSNLIDPEDHVDIIHTKTIKKDKEDIVETKRIFSNVRVIAVGQRITVSNNDVEIVEFGEVTLELLPDDAVRLINAYETGSLHLALHSQIIHE